MVLGVRTQELTPCVARDGIRAPRATASTSSDDERRYDRPSDIAAWPLVIEVPFPPESHASGIGDRGFHLACWYEREFSLTADGGRVLLHFGAVDYAADVWG